MLLTSRAVVAGSRGGVQDGTVEEAIWGVRWVWVHEGDESFLTPPTAWARGATAVGGAAHALSSALPHIAEFPLNGYVTNCAFLVTRLWDHPPGHLLQPPSFPRLDTEG